MLSRRDYHPVGARCGYRRCQSRISRPAGAYWQHPGCPVVGQITDLEFDYANRRLFVLERDSGAIAVIDLPTETVTQTLS